MVLPDIEDFDNFKSVLQSLTTQELMDVRKNQDFRVRNYIDFELGIRNEWWADWDKKEPIPFGVEIFIEDTEDHKYMSQVLHSLGWFDSVGAARRNGWNKPIKEGIYTIKNGKFGKRLLKISSNPPPLGIAGRYIEENGEWVPVE